MNNTLDEIKEKQLVKSYLYGDTLEMTSGHGQYRNPFRVIEGKRYVNTLTGEIFKMDTTAANRADNLNDVKRTMRRLRRLVSHNFNGGKNQLWITLTYAKYNDDPDKASRDYEVFMKRLRRRYNNLEYIAVIEPQASGNWHYHVLLKTTKRKSLYIPNEELAEMWGQGFTKTMRLNEGDRVGNYLVSYLSNLELHDSKENGSKKYAKGLRLHLYPKGLRIYRASHGIKRPIEATEVKEVLMRQYKVENAPEHTQKTFYKLENGQTVEYTTEFYLFDKNEGNW